MLQHLTVSTSWLRLLVGEFAITARYVQANAKKEVLVASTAVVGRTSIAWVSANEFWMSEGSTLCVELAHIVVKTMNMTGRNRL